MLVPPKNKKASTTSTLTNSTFTIFATQDSYDPQCVPEGGWLVPMEQPGEHPRFAGFLFVVVQRQLRGVNLLRLVTTRLATFTQALHG